MYTYIYFYIEICISRTERLCCNAEGGAGAISEREAAPAHGLQLPFKQQFTKSDMSTMFLGNIWGIDNRA